jgi:hypothetical protein
MFAFKIIYVKSYFLFIIYYFFLSYLVRQMIETFPKGTAC